MFDAVTAGHRLTDGSQSIMIDNARIDDAGDYVCIARNNAGTATSHIRLEVQGNYMLR